jgi:predicted DsbA family dithiol-disulfide isomerase
MKHTKMYAGLLLSLILSTGANALVVPDSGQDKRIEWNVLQSWPTAGKTLDMVNSLDGKFVFILNDKQVVQVFSSDGQLQGSIPVEEGVSAIDIAPRGEALYLINNKSQTFSAIGVSFIIDVDISGSPFRGPAEAPVTIVLFTDFECPYCSKIEPLLTQVLEKNPQTVKLVFKNMPLQFHKMAIPAARAALAARKQGKFWEFHDRLFAAQRELSPKTIMKIAQDLKLDIPRFEKDMSSPEIQTSINKDLMEAQQAGVTGTPTIYINGRTPKQRSLDAFQAVIDDEIRKLGKK